MTALMIESAARALLFALVVGAALRLFRVSNVPVRKAAWSLVLTASLAMPFLMRSPAVSAWEARWGWAMPVPIFHENTPAPAAGRAAAASVRSMPVVLAAVASEGQQDLRHADDAAALTPVSVSTAMDATAVVAAPSATRQGPSKWHWPPADRLMMMTYLGVAGLLLVRLLWGSAMAWRLWATADLVSPLVAPEPNVRSSEKIASPVTIGSGIVLPANYTEWDRKKLRMVLAHERSHVQQMDFYLQLLAGLYTAMFWFSPLGWWLRRTLASLGEAIGDRAGMDAAASGSGYAEVLLEFAALPRQTLPGVAMARPGNLSHRVERVLNEQLFRRAFAEGRRRAVVSLLLIPAALFAATVLIRVPGAAAQTAPQAPAAPAPVVAPAPPSEVAATEAPATPAAPESHGQTVPANAPEVPTAPQAPGAPTPAVAPRAPATGVPPAPAVAPLPPVPPDAIIVDDSADALVSDDDQRMTGYSYGVSNDGASWAIVDGPRNDVTLTGSWNSDRSAEIDAARGMTKGPFLWFTHEGKSYVVTDPAVIARVRALYKPMEPLSRQQEALGKQQEALGKQMEELARQQETAARVKMPDLSKEIAEMDAAVAKANKDREKLNTREIAEAETKIRAAQDQMMTPEKLSELQANLSAAQAAWNSGSMAEMQAKLGEMQARLGELQGEAGARQGDFGAKMGALGAQQGRLGAEQGRLGAQQGRIAEEADRQVREMIEQSLRNGTATPVPQVK